MPWPTWQQSAIAAVFFAGLIVVFRRARPTPLSTSLAQAATEMTIISGLYSIWRMARKLPLVQADGALDRGRSIADWQNSFFLPSELTVQQFLVDNAWLGRLGQPLLHRLTRARAVGVLGVVVPPSAPRVFTMAQCAGNPHGVLPVHSVHTSSTAPVPA